MTHPEFLKLRDKFIIQVSHNLDMAKERYASGLLPDISNYRFDDGVVYTTLIKRQTPDLQNYSAPSAVTELQKLEYSRESDGRVEIDITNSNMYTQVSYGGSVISVKYGYSYKIPKKEISGKEVEEAFKNIIKEKLKPESEKYDRYIDCKLYQLFLENEISWTAFQKMVYTGCNL